MNRSRVPSTMAPNAAAEPAFPRTPFWREFGKMLGCTCLSALLLLLSFPPSVLWVELPSGQIPLFGYWAFALICLVPWTMVVIRTQRAWVVHWLSFFGGWLFYLIALRWLYPVTGLGYVALAFYLAVYWPMAAWAIRAGIRHRISPIWTLPAVWVATEYLRAWVMSGFPWFFVGHAFYQQTLLIQVCDLTGVYGLSFLALMINGVVAEMLLLRQKRQSQPTRTRQLRAGAVYVLVMLLVVSAYGMFRLSYDGRRPGPTISVVQEDFPLESKPPYGAPAQVVFAHYLTRAQQAAMDEPDLVVFPETTWSAIQNKDFLATELRSVEDAHAGMWSYGNACHQAIAAFARGDYPAVNRVLVNIQKRSRGDYAFPMLSNQSAPPVPLIVGAMSLEVTDQVYPKTLKFNSALYYDRTGAQQDVRYDKMHLVPFGELVPFRNGRFLGFDIHWLYKWLNSLSPFSNGGKIEYTLTPGKMPTVFDLVADDDVFHFAVPICYEDVMPYMARRFVYGQEGKRVDFLLNISNDGWFREAELPQHLGICVFRAVENRVPIARAVNTGISGFIDSNGRIHDVVERDGQRIGRGIAGHSTAALQLDDRVSMYGRYGDWFAGLCLATGISLWLEAIVARWLFALRRRVRAWRLRGAP